MPDKIPEPFITICRKFIGYYDSGEKRYETTKVIADMGCRYNDKCITCPHPVCLKHDRQKQK